MAPSSRTHTLAVPCLISLSVIMLFWKEAQLSPWLPRLLLSKLQENR